MAKLYSDLQSRDTEKKTNQLYNNRRQLCPGVSTKLNSLSRSKQTTGKDVSGAMENAYGVCILQAKYVYQERYSFRSHWTRQEAKPKLNGEAKAVIAGTACVPFELLHIHVDLRGIFWMICIRIGLDPYWILYP